MRAQTGTGQAGPAASRAVLGLLLRGQWDAKETGTVCLPGLALQGK